ncbi:MAG: helix-turn-helix domain-containing protein [Eubacterium sp.]
MFDEYPDILTVSIQRALGIGRNTAYKLLKSKQIKSIRIGNKYKIPKRCLIAYALQIC